MFFCNARMEFRKNVKLIKNNIYITNLWKAMRKYINKTSTYHTENLKNKKY